MKNNKIPKECLIENEFERIIRNVLRPLIHQVPKSPEQILEIAHRRCESRMPLIRPDAIAEHILRFGLEMKLFTPEDEITAKERIKSLRDEL